MSVFGKFIGAGILSATTGIKTIYVQAEQLADIIDETFIRPASGPAFLDQVGNTIGGSKLRPKELASEDGRYLLYVSMFERGLTEHRTVWVKDCSTNQVFEWSGYTLGAIREAVEGKLAIRRMQSFEPPVQNAPSSPVENSSGTSEKAYFCAYCGTRNQGASRFCKECGKGRY